jgi:hypothetical protein
MLPLGDSLHDGALDYPGPDRPWSPERHRVNISGVADPGRSLMRTAMRRSARGVSSPDPARPASRIGTVAWLLRLWADLAKSSIIGPGVGRPQAGNVLTPPAAFAGPPPGIAADVVDDQRSIRIRSAACRPGAVDGHDEGLLKDDQRYEDTYWSRLGVWVHGDWAAIDEARPVASGPSDDTTDRRRASAR